MKETGGPAFPVTTYKGTVQHEALGYGMTLRDYFAAKALAVWVQAHIDQSVDDLSKPARECYSYADAMLAERDK